MNKRTKGTDWRAALRINERRTRFVMFLFIVIYLGVGFLIDTYMYTDTVVYVNDLVTQTLTPTQAAMGLLTLQLNAYATFIMGMVAIIAILLTYKLHDKIMLLGTQYKAVTADSDVLEEQQLYNIVEELKIAAGLRYMPKVFIIEAAYMNAFASGYSEKSAMVAITRGLLKKLNRAELQAVMAHELSHIKHHDIKLTLMASVLANIMLVAIDILFYTALFGRNSKGKNKMVIIILIMRYVLPIITLLLMLYLSRTREYMADAGCVQLMRDNTPLAEALIKIHEDFSANQKEYHHQFEKTAHENLRRAAYLYDPLAQTGYKDLAAMSLTNLYATHPSLTDRLNALGYDYESYLDRQKVKNEKSN